LDSIHYVVLFSFSCAFFLPFPTSHSDPSSHVSTTTRTYRTNSTSRSVPVSRELYYDSPDSTASRQSRTRQRSPPYEKVVETRIVRDNAYGPPDTGIYGGINKTSTPRSLSSPTPRALSSPTGKVERFFTESRTMSTDRGTLPRNVHYGENVETTVGPTAMEHIPVSGDLLPGPKTKVTTTVRKRDANFPFKNLMQSFSRCVPTRTRSPTKTAAPH
jgi:hypothetical protein